MKRSELTIKAMEERGFIPTDRDDLRIKDIVFNIQENEYWVKLRMTDSGETCSKDQYGMCSTYRVYYKKEYLEVFDASANHWRRIAYRWVETWRKCIYAD